MPLKYTYNSLKTQKKVMYLYLLNQIVLHFILVGKFSDFLIVRSEIII